MKRVLLYGEFAERFGKEHHFAVKNPAEAIRALCTNYPGFEKLFGSIHKFGIGFRIFVGGSSIKDYNEVNHVSSDRDVIRIVPVLMGSGNGFFKVLIGAVLIAGGALLSAASFGLATPLGNALIYAGAGMVINGVATLLTGPPGSPGSLEKTENKRSYIFNGPANVAAQGGPIPVIYGRMIVGSTIISAGIEAYDTTD